MSDVAEASWERRARRFGPLAIAACGLLAYANSFHAPFVFDGDNYLKANKAIRTLWPPDELLKFAQTRPVGYLSFALNYRLGELLWDDGYRLWSWHATNLAVHIAAACALFGIARRAFASPRLAERFGPSAARLGLAVALLWVVHPLGTQSVTYLYQRLESLMGLFYLTSLYAFVRYAVSSQIGWAAAAIVACLAATTTKEVAVTLPLMTLWYDRVFVAVDWGELLRRRGVFHLLMFSCLLAPAVMMLPMIDDRTYQNAGILDTERVAVAEYARTQPEIVLHYLRLCFVPVGLNIDYAWKIAEQWNIPATLGIGLLLTATLVALFRRPALGFLGGWWFVILAPTSSIAPIIDLAFEHRTYLPLIAPIALVVCLVHVAVGRLVARFGAEPETAATCRASLLVVAVALLTMLTLLRNDDYRSEAALWGDVAQKAPHNPRAHYNHGVYLQIAGSEAEIDAAIAEYHETLRLDPRYADAYLNLGNLAAWRKQWPDAERYYARLLELRPGDATAQNGLEQARKESATGTRP